MNDAPASRATPGAPDIDQAEFLPGQRGLHDLADRADLDTLLEAFYGSALLDPLLGPVFASAQMDLSIHLPRIASFWEVTLFRTGTYAGRPMQLHRHLATSAGLGAPHFERWLALWGITLTSLFVGPMATHAVNEARRMAVGMLRDIEAP